MFWCHGATRLGGMLQGGSLCQTKTPCLREVYAVTAPRAHQLQPQLSQGADSAGQKTSPKHEVDRSQPCFSALQRSKPQYQHSQPHLLLQLVCQHLLRLADPRLASIVRCRCSCQAIQQHSPAALVAHCQHLLAAVPSQQLGRARPRGRLEHRQAKPAGTSSNTQKALQISHCSHRGSVSLTSLSGTIQAAQQWAKVQRR